MEISLTVYLELLANKFSRREAVIEEIIKILTIVDNFLI